MICIFFNVALLEPLQTTLNKDLASGCAHNHNSTSSDSDTSSLPNCQPLPRKKGHLTVIPHCYVERILQHEGTAVGVAGVVHVYDETDTGPFRKPPLRSVKLVVRP
jgi:hypothetical protein